MLPATSLDSGSQAGPTLTTLVPADGITVPNSGIASDGTTVPDAKPTKFALFIADWIEMQRFVDGALRLGVSVGDFKTKYGNFDTADETDIENCVSAFATLHDAAKDFGNPTTLITEMQALGAGDKPASLYGQIVWLSTQIANAASTFHFTYSSLKEVLTDSMSLPDRIAALKDLLTGAGGLSSLAADMQSKTLDLQKALLKFSARIALAQQEVDKYASQDSHIYQDVLSAIIVDQQAVDDTEQTIKDLAKKYADYCAAAAAGSIGIMVITGGMAWPLAVADAAVFGSLAESARKAKNDAEDLLNTEKGELAQKTLLKFDISALNDQIGPIQKSVDKTAALLEIIAGVWGNEVVKFTAITDDTQISLLATYSALQDRLHILDAQNKWQEISADVFQFTAGAFVTIQ